MTCISSNNVLDVWAKASVLARLKKHIAEKIESLYWEYEKLKKDKENKVKWSDKINGKEAEWKDDLNLFDITHTNAAQMSAYRKIEIFCQLSMKPDVGEKWVMLTKY